MAEENSLVPKNSSGRRVDIGAMTNAVTNTEAVIRRIGLIRQNPEMTFAHKRRLIRAEVDGLFNARHKEIQARQLVLDRKLSADVEAASRAIDIYKNTLIAQMDDEFNKFVGAFGIKVAVHRVELEQRLAEQLDAFERQLKKSRLSKKYVVAILEDVGDTFKEMRRQIAGHISKAIVPEDDEK